MVKLPFATPAELLQKYGTNISRGGIYLRSRTVKVPGTPVTLDLRLSGGERILHASGHVLFVTGQQGQGVSGMGIRFISVDAASASFLHSEVATLPHGQADTPPVPPGVGPADYGPQASAGAPREPQGATRGPGAPTVEGPRSAAVLVGSAAATPSAPAFDEPTEAPDRTGPVIGIDLGTTNSCAAIVRGGKAQVLFSREGYNTVPSILALNARNRLVVGHPAKSQMLTNPRLTVYGAKRLVGRAYESPIVRQIKDRFPYEIAQGPEGEAAVKLGDRVYSLQQISALVLREVREIAQNQLGQAVSRAVITVPAYYNDNQRQAVREAGRLAGLHVERILNEPTAAALAYGYGRKLHQRILVYDLGGGTFDASVLELADTVYEVVSTGGDTFLGGIDFDNAIVEHLLACFREKTGREFQGDRVALQRITDAAERAKCALSERTEMRVHVPFVTLIDGQPFDLDVTLTRDTLVGLTSGLVDRTLQVCQEVLTARGLTPADIDEVILVGGQSRFPLVHRKIVEHFGKPPSKGVHADEAVALGAALLAHSLGQVDGVVLIDVLPMAIGVALPGGRFKAVLERNTAVPASRSYTIATSRDGQTELEVVLFQGEHARAQENEYLGTLRLKGLPRAPRGQVQVTVSFEVSNESLLKVTAREKVTGREVSSTFSTRDTPEAVKARLGVSDSVPPAPVRTPVSAGPVRTAVVASATKGGLFGWLQRLLGR
ncbi:MAG: TIGR02266 family protein [Myxococcaceae bacterium]|nr:TIGR02266 family protein [Myxococcaceae bacterium]